MNMKKIALFSFLVGCLFFFSSTIMHTQHESVLDADGNPSKSLLWLLAWTNVEHDGSLASIVQATQAAWIRKAGTERWDIADKDYEHAMWIERQFEKLNLIEEIKPSQKKYDYLLWMGAAYPRVQDRLSYAIQLWQEGVRFDEIVLLSGARPLTDAEQQALITHFNLTVDQAPVTEVDAMRLVYQRTTMPAEMQAVPLIVIDVPMEVAQNGAVMRPTTGDTVNAWMQLQPQPGNCLVISNQPYVGYQDSVVKTLLPQNFVVETVGAQSQETKIDVYLDTVARLLYQEKKRLQL